MPAGVGDDLDEGIVVRELVEDWLATVAVIQGMVDHSAG